LHLLARHCVTRHKLKDRAAFPSSAAGADAVRGPVSVSRDGRYRSALFCYLSRTDADGIVFGEWRKPVFLSSISAPQRFGIEL
jgi:hypothetical protein